MSAPLEPPTVPAVFRTAAAGLLSAAADRDRPGVSLQEVPAPQRLAPYSVALSADVLRGDEEIASGRFVVLHDPDGQDGWGGTTRIVAFVQADVDSEMAADPALAQAGWSWLTESLAGVPHTAAGGTVTRTVSCRFGEIGDAEEVSEVEIRASWTPLPNDDGGLDLVAHLNAWRDLLCATAGLPPPGVAALPLRR